MAAYKYPNCLPRARTCFYELYLPTFDSRKHLHDVIWPIIESSLKHKGFFEHKEWSS
jgi:hypothetical protein